MLNLLLKNFKIFPNLNFQIIKNQTFFESKLLKLNCEKAYKLLRWKQKLSINQTISYTALWYKQFLIKKDKNMYNFTISQIRDFINHKK